MKWLNNVALHLFQACGVMFLGLGFTVSTALAETITKPFEIGTSTSGSSHFRTFTLPCRTRMTASVTYARAGAAGEGNDVPIFIEVREPATTAEGEGSALAVKEGLTATRTPKTANLTGVTSSRSGCSIPWRVRVKHDASGPAPVAVTGTITVSFNTNTIGINVAGGPFSLLRDQSITKNVGDSNGIGQGTVVISGTWNHSVLGVTGPNPVKLKFELFDSSGQRVGVSEGYPNNEIRDLPKLRLTVRLPDCATGQWKVKTTNIDPQDDAKDIDVIVHFTSDCP